MSDGADMNPDQDEATRRDFLYITTGMAGAVTVGAAALPLVKQMSPSADVLALATKRVDLSLIEEGSQLTVLWQGKPVFIRHRTPTDIEEARAVELSELIDADARNENLGAVPATDENRAVDPEGKWLVQMGVCTHLGCVPVENAGDFGGWFCPCHGSHYDTAGRIRRGPAPENMPVPLVTFLSENEIQLG